MPPSKSPRQVYDTDMTDGEWEHYRQIFPDLTGVSGVSEPKTTTRELLNAMRYQTRAGCQWRNLPHDFPPWSTVKSHVSSQISGAMDERAPDGPSAAPLAA